MGDGQQAESVHEDLRELSASPLSYGQETHGELHADALAYIERCEEAIREILEGSEDVRQQGLVEACAISGLKGRRQTMSERRVRAMPLRCGAPIRVISPRPWRWFGEATRLPWLLGSLGPVLAVPLWLSRLRQQPSVQASCADEVLADDPPDDLLMFALDAEVASAGGAEGMNVSWLVGGLLAAACALGSHVYILDTSARCVKKIDEPDALIGPAAGDGQP